MNGYTESGPPPEPIGTPPKPKPLEGSIDQSEFDPLKLIVDPETGEILEDSRNQFGLDNLASVGRAITSIQHNMERLKANTAAEVERLTEHCDHKTDKLTKQIDFMFDRARILLEASGQKKHDIPGVATFALNKQASQLDSTEYDSLDEKDQKALQMETRAYYVTSTPKPTTKPDKKKMLVDLRAGKTIPGFRLNIKDDSFVFKSEINDGN